MTAAVGEGSELPLELKRAGVSLALTQVSPSGLRLDSDYYENDACGWRLAIRRAIASSPLSRTCRSLLRRLPKTKPPILPCAIIASCAQMQSNVLAKELDVRAFKSARLPQVDLVAQYAVREIQLRELLSEVPAQ